VGADSLLAEWDAVEGATAYQFRHRVWRQAWVVDTPSTDRTRLLAGTDRSAKYTIQVRAKVGRWKTWTNVVIAPN
jgi:hypothetical protein